MNEMIEVDVRINNDVMVTDSRNIAAVFNKRHDHVLRDIEALKISLPNFGEMFFETKMPDESGRGREYKAYLMNRDGFTLLAMGFTGKDALKWKLKYIEAFNKLERMINDPKQLMARALLAANEEVQALKKENEILIIDNKRMKPKEVFSDAVQTTNDDILIASLAKILKGNGVDIGQNRLYEWLRNRGYLVKRGTDKNLPTQKAINAGLFKIREKAALIHFGYSRLNRTAMVTPKGQLYFVNKFLAEKNNAN